MAWQAVRLTGLQQHGSLAIGLQSMSACSSSDQKAFTTNAKDLQAGNQDDKGMICGQRHTENCVVEIGVTFTAARMHDSKNRGAPDRSAAHQDHRPQTPCGWAYPRHTRWGTSQEARHWQGTPAHPAQVNVRKNRWQGDSRTHR